MEGPFGKKRYERLCDELTNILNSMGYQHKSKDKWQKAVADWKSKTRAKAAGIKINLSKTKGGGQGRQLSEIEERLIGDGNIELRSIQPDAGFDLQAIPSCWNSNENNYSFQIEATPLNDVEITPSPLISFKKYIVKDITIEEEPLTSQNKVPSSVPSEGVKKSFKEKQLPNLLKRKASTTNLDEMHRETLTVRRYKYKCEKVADSLNRMCTLHEQLLEFLKNGSS